TAAGVAGLIKVALALHHRAIPPTLHARDPNPYIAFDATPLRLQQTLTPWPESGDRLTAGISSFGFGGTNAHVVVQDAPRSASDQTVADTGPLLLPLSALTPTALSSLVHAYDEHLQRGALDSMLRDLCYTASVRRTHFPHRAAFVFRSQSDLA